MLVTIESLAKYYREILSLLGKGAQSAISNLVGSKSNALIADMSYFTQAENFLFGLETWKIKVPDLDEKTVESLIKVSAFDEDLEDDTESRRDEEDNVLKGQREQAAVLKAMWSKMATGKGDRESYYGFPLICGKNKGKTTVAPLFLFRIDILFNPEKNEFKLTKLDDVPAINWNLLSSLCDSDDESAGLYEGLRKYLGEGISVHSVKSFIDSLSHLLTSCHALKFKPFEEIDDYSFAREVCRQNSISLSNTPIVINAKKANLFLVQDLEAIANGKAPLTGKSVAGDFLKEYEVGESSNNNNLNIFESTFLDLCFPLVTNKEQVEAAKSAEFSKITVISGPPGTGKSHTIVNLITHLVSEGKSVLMTSQKTQALKVIKERMEKVGLADMAMAMLKGDAASKQELMNKIKEISTRGLISATNTRQYLERLKRYRNKTKADILLLEKTFGEARQAQDEHFQSAFDFDKVKAFDKISPKDEIPLGKEMFVASALREYRDIYFNSAFSINHLEEAKNSFHGNLGFGEVVASIQAFANLAHETYKKRKSLESIPYWNDLWSIACTNNITSEAVESIYEWVKAYAPDVKAGFEELQTDTSGLQLSAYWASASGVELKVLDGLLTAAEQNIGCIPKALNSSTQKDIFKRPATLADILRIKQIVSLLHDGVESWLKWVFSKDVKASRKFISSALNTSINRKNANALISNCNLWCAHWEYRFSMGVVCREASAFFSDSSLIVNEDDPLADVMKRLHRVKAHASLCRDIKMLCDVSRADSIGLKILLLLANIDQSDVPAFANFLAGLSFFLKERDALQKISSDLGKFHMFQKWIQDSAALCIDENISSARINSLSTLRQVVDSYPNYARFDEIRKGILSTLPETEKQIRRYIDNKQMDELFWCDQAEKAVEAQRLHKLLDLFDMEQINDNRENDCQKIAKKINELYEKLRQSSVTYVRTYQVHIATEVFADIGSRMQIDNLLLHLRRNNIGTLKEKINFKPILKVLPSWIMNIDDVARIFPLEEGLFDYVIIDEASQCNQATILHLLYRTKNIIIVGDEKQLGPAEIRFLKNTDISAIMNKYGLANTTIGAHFEPKNSLLQLSNYFAHKKIGLKEHFRSVAEIIHWSNKRFYNEGLKILTPDRGKYFLPPMEVRVINGAEDHETRINEAEANHIIELIRGMVNNKEYDELTIGIISPFRPQADYINLSLLETFGEKTCKKYMLHADTADGFQGDERDIIIYSFRQAPNSKQGATTTIQSDHGRVNVMFTRARRKVIAVTSIPVEIFPEGGSGELSFKNYLYYCNEIAKRPKTEERYDDKFDSNFEEDVCEVLRQQPWIADVRTQVPVQGSSHRIDLIIKDSEGRRLAVECDGPQHYDEYGELIIDDIWRQLYIERTMGISFYRIPATKWYRYKNEVLKELEEVLKDQETEADRLMISSIVSYDEGSSDDEGELKDSREDAVTATDNQEEMKAEEKSLTTEPELSEDKITEQVVSNGMIRGQINLFDKPKVSPVPKGVPKDWRTWYDISRWGREKMLINDYWWSFAIKAGDKLRNGWALSDKERNDMVKCWKMAIRQGFKYS